MGVDGDVEGGVGDLVGRALAAALEDVDPDVDVFLLAAACCDEVPGAVVLVLVLV